MIPFKFEKTASQFDTGGDKVDARGSEGFNTSKDEGYGGQAFQSDGGAGAAYVPGLSLHCLSCGKEIKRGTPKCPKCGSSAVGLLRVEEERVLPLVEKEGQKLTRPEEKLRAHAVEAARLIEKYGKPAAVALCARRVRADDVRRVLEKESKLSDGFYELVLEEERKAISKRFY